MLEGVEAVGELGDTARHADVAAVYEDEVGQLVEDRAVAISPLDWVPLGLYDAPLLVTEVILLDRVEVSKLRAVTEDNDHSVLDDSGSMTRAVYLSTQRTETLPCLGSLLVPDQSL